MAAHAPPSPFPFFPPLFPCWYKLGPIDDKCDNINHYKTPHEQLGHLPIKNYSVTQHLYPLFPSWIN